jgi:hypothetical protein
LTNNRKKGRGTENAGLFGGFPHWKRLSRSAHMENFLIALGVVVVAFYAGFQFRAVTARRRRRRQSGFY